MGTKKKKRRRKTNHYVVRISDNPRQSTQSRRSTHGSRRFWTTIILAIVFTIIVFVAFLNYRSELLVNREVSYMATIEELKEENSRLTLENEALSEKITILSETVYHKNEEVQAIAERSLPTGFPLSVAADIHEKVEDVQVDGDYTSRPTLAFTAGDGTYVLAAGDGIVSMVMEEINYGWEVQVDHGNGYVTSYRTNAEPKVKVDDEVVRGGILFEMKSENEDPAQMAYQMLKDGEYINPTDLLEING